MKREEQKDPASLCRPGAASHSRPSASCRACAGMSALQLHAQDTWLDTFPETYRLGFRFMWQRL